MPTFEQAIKKAIKAYHEMDDDDELEIHKNRKEKRIYNKKYFDKLEEEVKTKKKESKGNS